MDRPVPALRLALAVASALVLAASAARADDPVLHEHVARPPQGKGRIVNGDKPPAVKDDAAPPSNPTAIRQDEKIIASPPVTQPPAPREVVADRQTEAHPDYSTQADGTLHYVEVFNPAVVPFKRMSALDHVEDDYTLDVADRKLRPVPVGGQSTPDRDLFWGSLVVELPAGGGNVPIPSVAPDMRILSYEAQPRARLAFARDGADNFFVRAEDAAKGPLRIVFLVDAPAVYFAPKVPSGLPLAELAQKRPVAELPPHARASARVVLSKLGISRADGAEHAVRQLVEYYRGFEAGSAPSPSGDIYLDLALSRKGVCRHRAFAFLVTALAAGIPARYVTNEAHAFVEIWMPGPGWMRVDLGGAALELDIANAGDKAMHRPRGEDPFEKPRAYAENYTRLRGNVNGLSPQQVADASGHAAPPPQATPATDAAHDPRSTDPIAPPTQKLPRPSAEPQPGKRPLQLVVDSVDRAGYRGEIVRVVGHATGPAGPPEGLHVSIYLAPAGTGGDGARVVGEAVTDKNGGFVLAVELPADLGLGKHEVFALTKGDATYGAAASE